MRDQYSQIVAGKEEAQIVYEDDLFLAFIAEEALAAGQVTIIPKEKYTIFEMVPDTVLAKLGSVIKIVSSAVFESLQCHGTNVLIENGVCAGQEVPYFSVQVIPRFQGDGVALDWKGEELSDFDMENMMVQLKAQLEGSATPIMDSELSSSGDAVIAEDEKEAMEERQLQKEFEESEDDDPSKNNYLLKSLRKIP